ncbi:DISARM system-associated protein DrmE [Planomicrobium sp. Y74]|uniref:DISARM system-associated protein DrmE n=1 Tax=Planomicrobium sp. Y74 TaxID=2478977 RepID=UPI000EF4935E|nr:DISARM system-associated protein DrmE [Planomicrobium sp. Y74]RLQ90214.1 hypothetical protein D9754_10800 [Planomicrobium sp. Y74]
MKVLTEIIEKNKIAPAELVLKKNFIKEKSNSIIISENSNFQSFLITHNVLTYEKDFYNIKNPSKRTSILIITKNSGLVDILLNLEILAEDVYQYSKLKGNQLRENNIFCDLNNTVFAFVYWKDILYNYYNGNVPATLPLHYIFPIAKGRKNFNKYSRGNRNKLGRKDNKQSAVFIVSDILSTAYDKENCFDHIYIDGETITKPIEISKIQVNHTIFFESYFDYRLPFMSKNFENFYPLKEVDLISPNIKLVESPFNNEVNEIISKLNILKTIKFEPQILRIIWKLLKHILRTPIEGVLYDLIAEFDFNEEKIEDILKELRDSDFRFENQNFEDIIMLFEDIYNKYNLDRESPKFKEIEEWIENAMKRESKLLILVDGKIETMSLREKLAAKFKIDISALEKKNLTVLSSRNINLVEEYYDEVLITSLIDIKDLNILERKLGRKVDFILYEAELREIKKLLNDLKNFKNSLFDSGFYDSEELIYEKIYRKFRTADSKRDKVPNFSIDMLANSIASLPVNYNYRINKPYTGSNAITAKLIIFEDGYSVFLKITDEVNFRKMNGKRILTKKLSELEENDEMILINGDVREDLYTIFIKNVSSRNESKKHFEIVKKWRELYEDKFVYLKMSDEDLFNSMRVRGWDKTTKEILKNWRTGYSYGPRDRQDIITLGEVLEIPEFIDSASFFYDSMNHIRVEARSAARLLNKIIYFSKQNLSSSDNDFLRKYQLTSEEVQSAVHIKQVRSISSMEYYVKYKELGKIF